MPAQSPITKINNTLPKATMGSKRIKSPEGTNGITERTKASINRAPRVDRTMPTTPPTKARMVVSLKIIRKMSHLGTDCAHHPDLLGAFKHRHQNRVHDPDCANHDSNQHDG